MKRPRKNGIRSKTQKYFWKYIRAHKWKVLIIGLGLSSGAFLLNTVHPLIFQRIIDILTQGERGQTEILSQIFPLIVYFGIAGLLGLACFEIGGLAINRFQSTTIKDMQEECLAICHQHSAGFFANHFIGSLTTKIGRLVWGFNRIMDIFFWEFLTTIVNLTSIVVILFWFNPLLGWIMMAWTVIFIGISYRYSLWRGEKGAIAAAQDSRVSGQLADSLTNYFNVKIFSQKTHEQVLFEKQTSHMKKLRLFLWDVDRLYNIFKGVFMSLLEVIVLYLIVEAWSRGEASVGSLVLVQSVLLNVFRQIWNIGQQMKDVIENFANCEEMMEIIDLENEIKDPPSPEPCRIKDGQITFSGVTFAYEDNDPVFKDFNLNIKAGEKVGLVGESGSGKSTFTKLLLRFNDVDQGAITIDGQDIRSITQDDLRSHIAFVPQEPILFHRGLDENIRYGDLSATDQEIYEVARKAHAHEFILETKDGYKTLVGERGIKLSGGEKQRVAIARAMLKKAPILILDEATSSLDSKSESYIQEALETLMQKRTTLVIAHRLSTIQRMDRILVFDKGEIVEQGSHAELLKKKGRYAELWNHQVGGFIQ